MTAAILVNGDLPVHDDYGADQGVEDLAAERALELRHAPARAELENVFGIPISETEHLAVSLDGRDELFEGPLDENSAQTEVVPDEIDALGDGVRGFFQPQRLAQSPGGEVLRLEELHVERLFHRRAGPIGKETRGRFHEAGQVAQTRPGIYDQALGRQGPGRSSVAGGDIEEHGKKGQRHRPDGYFERGLEPGASRGGQVLDFSP